jgi:hypothetical protein
MLQRIPPALVCSILREPLLPVPPALTAALNVHALNSGTASAYPLKVSANNRYLVDENNVPFMIVGDSPQALIGNLSETEAAA